MNKIRMPRSIADPWLAALRSGDYKQGIGKLRYDDYYCCLGVLNSVAGLGYDDSLGDLLHGSDNYYEFLGEPQQVNLIHLNDNKRKTFPEIADLIEENLEYIDE